MSEEKIQEDVNLRLIVQLRAELDETNRRQEWLETQLALVYEYLNQLKTNEETKS